MKHLSTTLLLLALPLVGFAAHHEKNMDDKVHSHTHAKKEHGHKQAAHAAIAVVTPTEGNETHGHVLFEKVDGGIRVSGTIKKLTPGKHGFHVHEYGDLRKADGTSAAGHFNPKGTDHGGPDHDVRHIGDLGNIEADENGVAEFSFVDSRLKLKGPKSIIGRGLVVHAGEDDLVSQPTGDAGARVGVAVIGVANPEL